MADDPHPPLVGLSRACQSVEALARAYQADEDLLNVGCVVLSAPGNKARLRSELAALKLAIARAEEVLG